MTIRDMTLEDYEEVDALMQKLHQIHVQGRPDMYVDMAHPYSMEEYAHRVKSDGFLAMVAEEGERIVGLCFVELRERSGMVQAKTAYIHDFIVDESHQGKGVARALFSAAEERARAAGAQRLDLMVWAFNRQALGFYQHLGMTPQRYIFEKPL